MILASMATHEEHSRLHTHSVQYAYELVSTRRALKKTFAQITIDQVWNTASRPHDRH